MCCEHQVNATVCKGAEEFINNLYITCGNDILDIVDDKQC